MKNSRLSDVVAILAICAAGVLYWRNSLDSVADPEVTSTPVAQVAQVEAGQAPAFELPRVDGAPFTYKAGGGPALITLSAVGCAGCRQRVPTDLQAKAEAALHGVPVWNIFVYADGNSAKQFQAELHPQADEYLVDRDGAVSVRAYGGSDASCWILVNGKGKIVYRGPSDVAQLGDALKKLEK